jgi:hypothetical protein
MPMAAKVTALQVGVTGLRCCRTFWPRCRTPAVGPRCRTSLSDPTVGPRFRTPLTDFLLSDSHTLLSDDLPR